MSKVLIKHIKFQDYKTFPVFDLSARDKNVLVGPNNSGKSTCLDALRILFSVVRHCSRNSSTFRSHDGLGVCPTWRIPQTLFDIDVPTCIRDLGENLSAKITITLTNGTKLYICLSAQDPVEVILDCDEPAVTKPEFFRRKFPISVIVVPTLSPLDPAEESVQEKTARRNEFTRLGSRNFRNLWRFRGEAEFEKFSDLVAEAWNGIRVMKPKVVPHPKKPIVEMLFRDGPKVREVQWSGFGFQVWMQTMTYLLHSNHNTVFVLDEPDVYLHPDLQHKLVKNILPRVGQLFIATHSSEIINEVEPGDVVMVRPGARSGKRIKTESDYGNLFNLIGSSENAQFARLARTKKVLYVEGNDRNLLRKIGSKVGFDQIFDDNETTFMKTDGFSNWVRVNTTQWVFKEMFGFDVKVAAIFDKDYRSVEMISEFEKNLSESSVFCRVLPCKEIENLLLCPRAIVSAVGRHVKADNFPNWENDVMEILERLSDKYFSDVLSLQIGEVTQYYANSTKKFDGKTVASELKKDLEASWSSLPERLSVVPGKDCFAEVCKEIKEKLSVNLSPHRVANELKPSDISAEVIGIFSRLSQHFSAA